jgi:hypothetical protein
VVKVTVSFLFSIECREIFGNDREQGQTSPHVLKMEHGVKKLTVIVHLIWRMEEGGRFQERGAYALAAGIREGQLQTHYGGLGPDVGGVLVAQGGQGQGDGEGEDLAWYEKDWLCAPEVNAA